MKPLHSLALGIAAVATVGVAVAPADAQRRRERQAQQPAAQPGEFVPTLSREFREAIAPADAAATAQDWATATQALQTAAPLATTADERYTLGQVRLKIGLGQQDKAIQRAALQELVESGVGPADARPRYHYYLGSLAYEAGDNAKAIEQLSAARQAGYQDTSAQLMLAEAQFRSNQLPAGLQTVEQLIEAERAAGRTPPQDWYRRAATVAYQAQNMPEVAKWTRRQVEAYPTAENWRSALVIYQEGSNLDAQASLDLYRLKRAAGALTSERDYFEYAQAAFERGLFGEAKAVIDEGQAAGRVQRTAQGFSQIYTTAQQRAAAEQREVTAAAGRAGQGSAADAMDTGNLLLSVGNDAAAAEAFRAAIQKGGIDTNTANMRLGIALARAGQADAARQAFSQVSGPRADLAQFWTLYTTRPAAA